MGIASFGKMLAKATGLEKWRAHDASKTWDDNGDTEALFARIVPEVRALIAHNVKEGVAEYTTSGEFCLSVRNGGLWIDFRVWNDEGDLILVAPVRGLLNAGIAEAYKSLAANPQAQEFMSHIAALGKDINKLTQATPSRAPSAFNQGGQVARRVATQREAV